MKSGVPYLVVFIMLLGFACRKGNVHEEGTAEISRLAGAPREYVLDERAFVLKAVDDSYAIIEVAELAQSRGSQSVSSQATALKDGQMAILYQLVDYADVKDFALSEANIPNPSVGILVNEKSDFDRKWQREAARRNEEMIRHFEQCRTKDTNLRAVVDDVLTTLRFNRTVLHEYVAQSNH